MNIHDESDILGNMLIAENLKGDGQLGLAKTLEGGGK